MPDEHNEGQDPTAGGQAPPATGDGQDPGTGSNSEMEKLKSELSRARSEAAASRKELSAYKDAEEKRKQAELSETDQLKSKVSTLESQIGETSNRALKAELKVRASEKGINGKIAADLVFSNPALRKQVSFGESGELVGADEALEGLKSEYPDLFKNASEGESGDEKKPPKVNLNPTNPGSGEKRKYTKQQIEQMSQQQLNAIASSDPETWKQIKATLRE